MARVLTILSAISLFIVAIFYACIRELRSNIIGKLILMLAISDAIFLIIEQMIDTNPVVNSLMQFLFNSNTLAFLAIAYETFVLLKYSMRFST
jgi:hypothetical protein